MSLIYINPYTFAAANWTPANITTQLWLDASDSSTVTTVSSKVSQWDDKSGNARNATQSTDAIRPTYTTAELNGLNVVTFDTGGLRQMTLSSVIASGSTAGSVFWVQKNTYDPPTASEDAGALFRNDWGFDGNENHLPWIDSNVYVGVFRNARPNMGNPTPSLTNPRILSLESGSNYEFRIDGASVFTSSSNSFAVPAGNKTIGGSIGFRFRGYAAEIVVVNSVLSSSDREKIEGYLAHKWGLTGNLDAGHPYKTTAPTA